MPWRFLELLLDRPGLPKGDVQFGPQRLARRTEERKFFAHPFQEAPRGNSGAEREKFSPVTPEEHAPRRGMEFTPDLEKLVDFFRLFPNILHVVHHTGIGGIEEQLHGNFLGLASDKLLNGRVQARDGDFGDLDALIDGVTLWIKERLKAWQVRCAFRIDR